MIEQATEHPKEEIYGDEQRRLEELRILDYLAFKQELVGIHNSSPGVEAEDDFVLKTNGTFAGKIFPVPEDKDMLLEYALEQSQSQEDIQTAALILGVAIVFTHPFNDGNGRTSRTLYGKLSRGFKYSEEEGIESELIRKESIGRDFINFEGIDFLCGHWIEGIVYNDSGINKSAAQAWHESSDEEAVKHHYGEREYKGLTSEEAKELDMLLGEKHGRDGVDPGRYSGNTKAVLYALNRIEQEEGIELPKKTFGNRIAVITPDALAAMDGDQKIKLTEYIRNFNTLYAKAAVDLLGKYGSKTVTDENGQRMSVISYIVSNTNNYLASKTGGSVLDKIVDRAKKSQ